MTEGLMLVGGEDLTYTAAGKEGEKPREHVLPEGRQRGSVSQESGHLQESRSLTGWMLERWAIAICLYCYHLALQNINSALLLGNHMGLMKCTQLLFCFLFLD